MRLCSMGPWQLPEPKAVIDQGGEGADLQGAKLHQGCPCTAAGCGLACLPVFVVYLMSWQNEGWGALAQPLTFPNIFRQATGAQWLSAGRISPPGHALIGID
jgi:hypothetical protein